jgi:subtilisin family serine protease/subtilisin-like proprotein convertase family protein
MKRLSSGTWFLISLMLLALGAFFWLWGDRIRAQRNAPAIQPDIVFTNGQVNFPNLGKSKYQLVTQLQEKALKSAFTSSVPKSRAQGSSQAVVAADPRFPYRLRNTVKTVGDLSKTETAILLNNATIDSSSKVPIWVPDHLRASEETESYLLQSVGPFDQVFDEASLKHLGITKVAYIPHNTWIVRMTPEMSQRIKGFRGTQAVLPFEPYFKLSDRLLEFAVMEADIPGLVTLQLTLFKGEEEAMFTALEGLGTEYLHDGVSPFGPTVIVKTKRNALSKIASLDGVLTVETVAPRVLANDLTRVRIGVDDSLTNMVSTNFHELSGKDILVNINDTGVDGAHPDLTNRVFSIDNVNLRDPDGHGTHVAGTIASSGANSPMVTNVFGSPTNANYHGMAPDSKLFVLPIDLITGPLVSDAFLQERAAEYNYVDQSRTNALISNNSWGLRNVREYNSSAASFDAAVRDALPEMEGDQPVLYVFSAGNTGSGNSDGRSGEPASISSPATAKNVITVGSIESLRFITNEVITGFIDEVMTNDMGIAITNEIPIMERLFQPPTDSATQVSDFSSRGNVGIGIEGDFGRFKPDVVAPGSFTISTSPTNWVSPEQFLDVQANTISNQTAIAGELVPYTLFARTGTSEIEISVLRSAASPESMPRMPIYARFGATATTNDLVGFSSVTINGEESSPLPVQAGVLFYSIGNPIEDPVSFDLETRISVETESDGYFEELAKLNDGLGPLYRFESGTSMAAPAVTGMLALFQEFLVENDHNPSPALLKALLINGSRTASELYDFQVDPVINFQGWGTINLGNSLPNSMFQSSEAEAQASLEFVDQSTENALATGEHRSWNLTLNTNEARALPLRLSLVWTDPPGNPSAGIKLVNDLDLIVSNTVSGEIFYGNDFKPDELFTSVTSTNGVPRLDNVNNVENIYISPPLSTNYVVSVVARRVNVNSVNDHPDGVVQDFALVISSGDNPAVEAPFKLEPIEDLEIEYVEIPALVSITNSIPRLSDRVGANAPLLGTTNGLLPQWQFYVFTNSLPSTNDVGFTNGPNVAFVTFLPPNLGLPRNLEADVDLFVSRDAGLLDLNETVVGNSFKSTMPGGSEVVILENQPLGDDVIYYIGVKSEDHQGGQYAFVGISQVDPFDEEDEDGNRILRGVPLNQGIIPDGSPNEPGAALVLALGNPLNGLTVQSAVAELALVHDDIGDLLGNLSHNGVSMVLNNHTLFNPNGTFGDLNITYDDFETIVPSFPSDGPGSLINYIGENGVGVWLMSMVDNALTHTGRVFGFNLILTPNRLLEGEGINGIVQPESFAYYVIEVPTDASALDVNLTEFDLPLDLYLRREELPTLRQFDKRALGTNDSNGLTLRMTRTDIPPLNPGQYFVGVYNPNFVPVEFRLTFDFERDLLIDAEQPFFAEELGVPLTDDAITRSTIFVADTRGVADVKVGVRIDHPRVSDLTMHLVSPLGTRVLLSENRGGPDASGWGSGPADLATYGGFSDDPLDSEFPIKFAPPPYSTNAIINVVQFSGFEEETAGSRFGPGDTFLANAQSNLWEVFEGRAIIGGGNQARAAEGANFLNLGSSRVGSVLAMEPGRKVDLFYSSRSSAGRGAPVGQIFLDGVRAQIVDGSFDWRRNSPVRFTPGRDETLLELGIVRGRPPMQIDDIEIRDAAAVKYFLPEEELERFDGQPAVGEWSLEVWDNRAGAIEPQPILQNWQLLMSLAETNFPATALSNGECVTNIVVGDEIQYYIVDVPRIATIATNWLSGTGDLVMLWNEDGIPMGESPPDVFPPIDFNGEDEGEGMSLSTQAITIYDPGTNRLASFPNPVLRPGQRYYLGVKNADPDGESNYEICVQFDQDDVQITTLTNLIAFTNRVEFSDEIEFQYYRYRAGSNVLSMDIEIFPEDGDVNAVEKFGLPLPNLVRFENRAEEIGLDPELITISNRAPATIFPGDYFIGVYNVEPNQTDVQYSIVVTETTVPYNIIRLPNGEPIDFSVGQNVVDESALFGNYFLISVTNSAISQARIDLTTLGRGARVVVKKDVLPTLEDNDQLAILDPNLPGSGRIVIRTNAMNTNIIGDWFVAVLNEQPEDLEFQITGSTFSNNVPVIDLPNFTWFTNTVVPSVPDEPREVDYYRFVVSEKALDVSFTVEPIVGGETANVDLRARMEFIPLEGEFDFESANDGPADEFIGMGPGFSGPIVPGEWLLAVLNNEDLPVTYRIRVNQNLDLSAPKLIDGIWTTNTVAAVPAGQLPILDIYEFNVSRLATSATFELESLVANGPGNLDLVLRQGEFPDLVTFDSASINAGLAQETIILDGTSSPEIAAGRWFLGVINRENVAVPYRIRATQVIPAEPPVGPVMKVIDPDVTLVGNEICLSWDSVPGVEYFVQGKIRVDDTVWDGLRGPILASTDRTTECFDNTIPYQFFRIIYFEGDEPPAEGEFLDTNLVLSPTDICVGWEAIVGTTYTVQAKRSLEDLDWETLTIVEADQSQMQHCVLLPTSYRIFRVGVGIIGQPVDEIIDPELVLVDNQVCLRWPSEVGQTYTIEGKNSLDDGSWLEINVVLAIGNDSEYCINLPTDFRFFRIRRGGELPVVPEFIDPTLSIGVDDICLTWVAVVGRSDTIQGKASLVDLDWVDVDSVVAESVLGRYCVALPTDLRFFRIQVGELIEPTIPDFIDPVIQLADTELCVSWVSVAGFDYAVEGKSDLASEAWTEVALISATAARSEHCLALPTEFRFFRIRGIGKTPVAPQPGGPTVFVEPGINLTATDICLDWAATAGQTYTVEGKRHVAESDWTELGVVLADNGRGGFCIELPTEFRFFRIAVSEPVPPGPGPVQGRVIDPRIGFTDSQVCLEWDAVVGSRYAIQGRAEIVDQDWVTVVEVLAAEILPNFCIDLATQYRFFRVVELGMGEVPVEPPVDAVGFIDPFIRMMADDLCIDWASQAGVTYEVQLKEVIDAAEWTTVETLEADGDMTSVCLPGATNVGFFRVAILQGDPPIVPAPDPVNPLAFESIVPSDLGVTLNWIADSGSTFVVEFSDVIPPNWSSSVPVTSDTGEFSYLDSGEADGINSPTRYYRLREIAP